MYPYEIQHRRGELLEIWGDTNISLSILVVKHGIYIWTYNVYYAFKYKNKRATDDIIWYVTILRKQPSPFVTLPQIEINACVVHDVDNQAIMISQFNPSQ